MKMKLLLFLGLIIGSFGASTIFSPTANAAGETYRWQDANTIIGTGGSFDNKIQKNVQSGTTTRATPVGSVTFTREGTSAIFKAPTSNIFYTVTTGATSGGSRMCNLQLAITVNTTNTAMGNLQANDPGQAVCPDSGIGATAAITGTGPDPASFTTAGGGPGETEEVSSCQIDGIGWILCPVMNFIGGITDQAYVAVQALLTTQPLTFNTTANPVHDAWTIMRNFANIMFVIVFLLIIFSQITSVGVSNYGIKKILPRLIVVAILVNVSYIICALAVDISNILGSSLKSLLDGITANYKLSLDNEQAAGIFNGDNMFTNIIGAVLAGGMTLGITLMLGLSVLLPIAITALAAIVTVVVVLTIRQALIIVLTVISPLAFIAFLLPNTEDWFTKWRKLFTTLLLMYPIIAIIFGASAFTGAIIMNSAEGNTKVLTQIMGAGVTIIPLFITPIVMKTAGTLLNRIGGNLNNPNKGPFDRMRKGAQGIRERSKVDRGLRALDPNKFSMPGRRKAINFANKRKAIAAGRAEQFQDMQKEQIAKLATDPNSGFAKKVAGDAEGKAELYSAKQASYLSSIDPDKLKLEVDTAQLKNMVGTLSLSVKDPANKIGEMQTVLQESVASGDSVKARAAQQILMESGNKGRNALRESLMSVDPTSETGIELRKDIANSNMKGSAADVYTWSIDKNHRSLDAVSKDAGTWSGLADAQVAGQVEGAMKAATSAKDAAGNLAISPQKAASVLNSRGSENIGEKEAAILKAHARNAAVTPSVQTTNPTINNTNPNLGRTASPSNLQGAVILNPNPQQPPSGPNPPNNP